MKDPIFNRLQLCCEETFAYLIELVGDSQKECLFCIHHKEEGFFTEIICGEEVDDIDQHVRPFSDIQANEQDLSRLGLLLLAETASDLQHIHISGYTYISFVIDSA